jgi:uncharacterized protein (TIGR02588 family)
VAEKRGEKTAEIPNWSWLVAALGFVLVAGSSSFMLYQAVAAESSPPAIAIEMDAAGPSGDGYLIPIRVMNRGGSAAAALVIEGVLREGTATVETSTITIQYVPSGSQREAGLIFSKDPSRFAVQIRAKGYEHP